MSKNLARNLSSYSGLDEGLFNDEFDRLLEKYGKKSEQITLPELREILAQEIQSVLLDLKESTEGSLGETPQDISINSKTQKSKSRDSN